MTTALSIDFRNALAPIGSDLVIVPHHFDRLRHTREEPADDPRVSFDRALTWNLFRALELLPPAFWLRRLRARLQDPNPGVPAPTLARVALWKPLDPSPTSALTGSDTRVVPDVLIETEFTVWTLVTVSRRDMTDQNRGTVDQVMRVIDAGTWYAGSREHCFGLIVGDPADAPHAVARVQRYARHAAHAISRQPFRSGEPRLASSTGVARWRDIGEILGDCARSDALAPVERAIAAHVVEWLAATREYV